MTMNKQILYILSLMGLLSFAACTNEEEPALSEGTGEIRLSVVDATEVVVDTKASSDWDVEAFSVSLSQGGTSIFSDRPYGDIAGTSISCVAGDGYQVAVESCTEERAESVNNNWGQARMEGKETFAVLAGQPTDVAVECRRANASVEVDFSDFIESLSDYSIEIHATDAPSRVLTFNQSNYKAKTAYFNVDESRELSYTVDLPTPYKPYEGTCTLEPSKNYKLSVTVTGEGTNTTATLGITVDGTLLEEITLKQNINPYE